ncbi:hypothetical protein [Emticicia sp. BO119]|uniref:hypothetical protein n=1 Tax=Emticicia sp. BO119 TaxID=2757768 RepID=UPI0015F09853|nr:hypothetical protein [Emticicia sp. BO119]MBA4853684.1 hypothetical protein [Emticicia sp. BO119]
MSTEKDTSTSRYRPLFRRLRGYAFDPSLSTRLEMAEVNLVVFKVKWEDSLKKGPIGEYLEVIDIDPASKAFYEPVDLNDEYILALDGLPPSESNPQFHQQMVYAVAMITIENFEKALGRKVLWSSFDYKKEEEKRKYYREEFVQRLRLYPHAIREANAYYSPDKKAVLFGYFVARPPDETAIMPGTLVFTCLSHDIIAHEVTHALIDGQHKQYVVALTEDTLALHEAFSDIVALFQHFTFPEVLKNQIAQTRGELENYNLLGELAQQLGLAIGNYGSLRNALGSKDKDGKWQLTKPNPLLYKTVMEAHGRGAILVATIFRAFLKIYKARASDLFRIYTNGTGVLPEGAIHPDMVNRLASEASLSAKHVLSMCIRALDYCPPVRVNFGDFLRAIITADNDLVADDDYAYRVAFIESFKEWGIYPKNIFSLSEESLIYNILNRKEIESYLRTDASFQRVINEIEIFSRRIFKEQNREKIFEIGNDSKFRLHRAIRRLMVTLNKERFENKGKREKLSVYERTINELEKESRHIDAQYEYDKAINSINNEKTQLVVQTDKASKLKIKELDKAIEYAKELFDRNRQSIENEFTEKEDAQKEIGKRLQILEELSGFIVPLLNENAPNEGIYFDKYTIDEIEKTEGFLSVSSLLKAENKTIFEDNHIVIEGEKYQPFIKINRRLDKPKSDKNNKNNKLVYYPNFQVYNLHYSLRVGPDSVTTKQVILSLYQDLYLLKRQPDQPELNFDYITEESLVFRGGSTLIIEASKPELKYRIVKRVNDINDIKSFLKLEKTGNGETNPFVMQSLLEPFAMLHRDH